VTCATYGPLACVVLSFKWLIDQAGAYWHTSLYYPIFLPCISFLTWALYIMPPAGVPIDVEASLCGQATDGSHEIGWKARLAFYSPNHATPLDLAGSIFYLFGHANFVHLYGNLAILTFFGIALEVPHGFWRVALIYLASGWCGAFGFAIQFTDCPAKALVGASGACCGIVGACLSNLLINWDEMKAPKAFLLFNCLSLYGADIELWNGLLLGDVTDDQLAHTTHLFGFIEGLLLGLALLRNIVVLDYERKMQSVSAVLAMVMPIVLFGVWGVADLRAM
jgi:membrane associated rhomboid family serine protease